MNLTGLTDQQVAERVAAGRVNHIRTAREHTIPGIILRSTLTMFNLVNLVLALLIIAVGSYKNLLFILVAIANTLISIINSVRAKKTIDKLRLQSQQNPSVIRNGSIRQIPADQLVEGDLLVLSIGDQILVDSIVTSGEIEVNEAYITGEQDNITKKSGAQLTSGSFVVSGTCYATVTSVGADNFLCKLESSAHRIQPADSKLFSVLNRIVKYISIALIPTGILLLWRQLATQHALADIGLLFSDPSAFLTAPSTQVAVTGTVAALINMIPEGLVLLTSSVLALATIRLARQQVLVQDLYSIETLARVDTICLDKTGTLTTGKMRVKKLIPAPKQSLDALQDAFRAILSQTTVDNATSAALRAKLLKKAKFEPTEPILTVIPFSSERKYSGIRTPSGEILMGALEFITSDSALLAQLPKAERYRVISVVKRTAKQETLLGFALLEDEIRSDAPQIIRYFGQNDVAVKIISGDHLATIQSIASAVGVPAVEQGVDLSALPEPLDYNQLVQDYTIFARVTPTQKKSLISALKKQGHTVAMTGDGVNDILALREADCSIAIGAGADAARRAAQIVLLSSDFAAVPSIIAEGRQTINNLERSGTLFLTKTIYASILAVLFTLLPLEYPYAPIEMSFLNVLCIGLPGLALALETNTARIKDQFVRNIKKYSLPTGLIVAVAMLILACVDRFAGLARPTLLTLSSTITFAVGLSLIYRLSRPLNAFRLGLILVIIAIFAAALLFPPVRLLFVI